MRVKRFFQRDDSCCEEEDLSLDVVSGGELYTAIQAGFPTGRIHFHGNNKSEEELLMALDTEIGCFVVDNFLELELLHDLAKQRQGGSDFIKSYSRCRSTYA